MTLEDTSASAVLQKDGTVVCTHELLSPIGLLSSWAIQPSPEDLCIFCLFSAQSVSKGEGSACNYNLVIHSFLQPLNFLRSTTDCSTERSIVLSMESLAFRATRRMQ